MSSGYGYPKIILIIYILTIRCTTAPSICSSIAFAVRCNFTNSLGGFFFFGRLAPYEIFPTTDSSTTVSVVRIRNYGYRCGKTEMESRSFQRFSVRLTEVSNISIGSMHPVHDQSRTEKKILIIKIISTISVCT